MLGPRKVILVSGGRLHRRDDFDTLAGWWTADVGTAAVVGGALQGATLGDVLLSLVTNGEFTVDTTGWTALNVSLSRRDFTAYPVGLPIAPTGGLNDFGAELHDRTASSGSAYQFISEAIVGARYVAGGQLHSPSLNTVVNAARLLVYRGDYSSSAAVATTSEDVWQYRRTAAIQMTTTAMRLDLLFAGSELADVVYYDAISCRRQNTVLTAQCKPNGTVQAGVAMPAAGVVPRSVILRRSDSLNYWEARMLPNTAATDLQLYEVNAGAHQLRASADIDWTADATDEVQVSLKGATIEVYHRKAGAAVWTLGCSYASATHNQTATRHGGMLWNTGVNAFTYWEYRS